MKKMECRAVYKFIRSATCIAIFYRLFVMYSVHGIVSAVAGGFSAAIRGQADRSGGGSGDPTGEARTIAGRIVGDDAGRAKGLAASPAVIPGIITGRQSIQALVSAPSAALNTQAHHMNRVVGNVQGRGAAVGLDNMQANYGASISYVPARVEMWALMTRSERQNMTNTQVAFQKVISENGLSTKASDFETLFSRMVSNVKFDYEKMDRFSFLEIPESDSDLISTALYCFIPDSMVQALGVNNMQQFHDFLRGKMVDKGYKAPTNLGDVYDMKALALLTEVGIRASITPDRVSHPKFFARFASTMKELRSHMRSNYGLVLGQNEGKVTPDSTYKFMFTKMIAMEGFLAIFCQSSLDIIMENK
jgi:hypothetical protein